MRDDLILPGRFTGLHAHDGFSVGDGFGSTADHVDFVLKNGGDSLAITNHGNGSSLPFLRTAAINAKKKGQKFKPLYGVEFYFVPSLKEWRVDHEKFKQIARDIKNEEKAKKAKKVVDAGGDVDAESDIIVPEATDEDGAGHVVEDETESKSATLDYSWKRRYHLVVLARNQVGLTNLFTLVKKSFKDGFFKFPRIDFDMLKQHGEGLVVSTACLASIYSNRVIRGEAQKETESDILCDLLGYTDRFVDAVGTDNFFLEIQFNKLDAQHACNRYMFEVSERTGIPLVATADSHYPTPDKWQARELYRMVMRPQWAKSRDLEANNGEAVKLPAFEDLKCELYPKNASQMWDEYRKAVLAHPEIYVNKDRIVCDAIERTHDIAWERCESVDLDSTPKLPNFSTPSKSAYQQLEEIVYKKLSEEDFAEDPVYIARVAEEMEVIKQKGFENYFLVLYKIFQIAENETMIGPGRGSATGFLVNFLLGLTGVDPIKYNLMASRFLNLGRAGFPDIDSDCADREVLIDVARRLFGEDSVIPVSNFNLLKLKSVIKDVSKFYDVPFEEVNDLTGPLQWEVEPHDRGDDVEKSVYVLTHDACMKYSQKYRDFMAKYPQVAEHVKDLFMQNRSIGRHAGGVLVCPDLEKTMPLIMVRGELQTPWTEGMNFRNLESLGYLKLDILGLTLLDDVQNCIKRILVKKGHVKPTFLDVKKWFDKNLNCRYVDPVDQKVFKYIFQEARFTGVFQFTQSGARHFCTDVNPKNVTDLAAITAIYRPGPLKADVHKKYVAAEFDPDPIVNAHPIIKKILGPTRGFVIFQEAWMLLAQELSGFSGAEADGMRKTLVKKSLDTNDKKADERVELRKKFVEGAQRLHGIDPKITDELFTRIAGFSLYGFSLNHSLPYVVDSYYAAWLHTYYEKEWLATCLQSETGKPKELSKIISEVKQLGYKIAPHDINRSDGFQWIFNEDIQAFVPPLSSVKGIGKAAVREILSNRPYKSVDDMLFTEDGEWRHSKMNKTCFDALCCIDGFGSLDDFNGSGLLLKNHAQLRWILSENDKALHKGRFGLTKTQVKKQEKLGIVSQPILESLARDHAWTIEDWTRNDKILMAFELTSSADESLLFPPKLIEKFEKAHVTRISEVGHAETRIAWFMAKEIKVKHTKKNNKAYLQITAIDDSSNIVSVKIWGGDNTRTVVEPFSIWMCTAKGDAQWGPSTTLYKMRKVEVPD